MGEAMKVTTRAVGLIVALGAIPLAALPAQAVPSGHGCQQGFDLVSVSYVLSQATPGFELAIQGEDVNRDNLLCYKLLPSAVPLFEPTFLYYDNTKPIEAD
jgi:hypothetical protein